MTLTRKLGIGLVALIVLSPLGLLLPEWFGAGSAWGEWSAEELGEKLGFVPRGLARLSELWHAPMPDYAMPSQEGSGLASLSASYVISAALGAALVIGLSLLVGRLLARRQPDDS